MIVLRCYLALKCSKQTGNPGQFMFFLRPLVGSHVLMPATPPDANESTSLASKWVRPSKFNKLIGYAFFTQLSLLAFSG